MAEQQNPLGPEGSYFEAKARKEQEAYARKANGTYPIFITFLYLFLGCVFNLWHPGWLLFLTIPLFYMRPQTTMQKLCNPVMVTLIYLVLGFFFGLWHPGWLVFLAIPAAAIVEKTGE